MRYVVIGTSGSGKSTFGRRLAAAARSPFIELDELHWAPNWVERPDHEFVASVDAATGGDRWVVDGNYSMVRHVLWPRATHIVWLNFSRSVVSSRVVWRTLRRAVLQERLWHDNRESFTRTFFTRDSILLWSLTTYEKNRRKYEALRASGEFAHLTWSEFRAPRQADAFLESVRGRA